MRGVIVYVRLVKNRLPKGNRFYLLIEDREDLDSYPYTTLRFRRCCIG